MLPGVPAIALMASLPMLRAFLVFLGSILAASTRPYWLAWDEEYACMHIQSMHKCIYFHQTNALMHFRPYGQRVGRFSTGEKKPARWRAPSYARRLTGVHPPPEHMTEDADLLILDILEAVVFIRVFIAIETT